MGVWNTRVGIYNSMLLSCSTAMQTRNTGAPVSVLSALPIYRSLRASAQFSEINTWSMTILWSCTCAHEALVVAAEYPAERERAATVSNLVQLTRLSMKLSYSYI